jgi:hypothetical protein
LLDDGLGLGSLLLRVELLDFGVVSFLLAGTEQCADEKNVADANDQNRDGCQSFDEDRTAAAQPKQDDSDWWKQNGRDNHTRQGLIPRPRFWLLEHFDFPR